MSFCSHFCTKVRILQSSIPNSHLLLPYWQDFCFISQRTLLTCRTGIAKMKYFPRFPLSIGALFVAFQMLSLSHAIEVSDMKKRLALFEAFAGMEIDPSPEATDAIVLSPSPTPLASTSASPSPNPIFAFESSRFGIIRTDGAGITVSRGTGGDIRFAIAVKGIISSALADLDDTFVATLNKRERRMYNSSKNLYDGGLGVPFLKWIGADLNKNVALEDLIQASEEQENYEAKSLAVKEALEKVKVKTYQISGSKSVIGKSFIPKTFFAYIKAARIYLSGGNSLLVISSNRSDVIIATDTGVVFDNGAEHYNVTETM